MEISPIFNVKELVQYKGPIIREESQTSSEVKEISIPLQFKPQDEKLLDSRVKKKTKQLIKWNKKPESKETWIA